MSDSIREKYHEFPTMLKTKSNGNEINLSLNGNHNSLICGEIMFSVQHNPQYTTELNPASMIAMLEQSEINEPSQMTEIRARLEKELEICSAKTLSELTPKKNHEYAFEIELTEPLHKPIAFKSLPLPYHLKCKVKQALTDQLKAGIIQQSRSSWVAPLRIVHKPDFSIRITVDYSHINKIIKMDRYPLTSVAELYSKLGKAKICSKIDLKAAYHQIPMHSNSIEVTAFICEFGLFEYLSVPMGISSAPAWFQRFINGVLRDFLVKDTLGVDLDDIILFSASLEEHETDVLAVLARLKEKNVKISFEKSQLVSEKI